jgi:uncharacterized protein YecE (DUF72 family)
MDVVIGTSGWMYRDWNGRFYPEEIKGKDQLPYFATQFESVEINSTFYHVPRETTLQNWYDITPENFTFAIKLNRYLTHTKRLLPGEEFDEALEDFFKRIALLKQKLAVVLVQLPPSMRQNTDRLDYLAAKTKEYEATYGLPFPLAIEFRHASWFAEGTFALMKRHNLANVINDSPNRWPASKAVTADFAYIRLHGSQELYRSSYTEAELSGWAEFIKSCKGCHAVYAYFDNDYQSRATQNARSLRQKFD